MDKNTVFDVLFSSPNRDYLIEYNSIFQNVHFVVANVLGGEEGNEKACAL